MQVASKAMVSINKIHRGLIMKCLKSLSVLGVVLTTSYAGLAQADLSAVDPAFSCDNGDAMTLMNPDAIACSGAWEGNNAAPPEVEGYVLSELAASFNDDVGFAGNWSTVGTTNAGDVSGSGPFNAWRFQEPSATVEEIELESKC
jgi:hypothetical protein